MCLHQLSENKSVALLETKKQVSVFCLGCQIENSHVWGSADSQMRFSDKVNPALGFLVPDQKCHNHKTQSADPVLIHIVTTDVSQCF